MRLLSVLYVIAIIAVLVIYTVGKIDFIWLLGYLIILLATSLVPKKIFIQIIVALSILAVTVYLMSAGFPSIATLLTAFLMVSTGLPGIISYAAVLLANYFLIRSPLLASTIGAIPYYILLLLIGLHLIKHFSDGILKSIWFIPIIDLIPLIFDIAITILMSVIIFTHVAQLYPAVQSGVNYLFG